MKFFKTIISLGLLFWCLNLSAQITVNNSPSYNNPYWLVKNILVDMPSAVLPAYDPPLSGLAKVQPTSTQVGFFHKAGSTFPLDSGIVMVTDGIGFAVPGGSSTLSSAPTPDADLTAVVNALGLTSNNGPHDKSVIEFSIVAVSDSFQFKYIFASNEYSGYTCSVFNDVFGFFITGYGINGNPGLTTVNIARIPGTTVPVAINTLNGGAPTGGNTATNCINANPNYVAHSMYFSNNSGLNNINFNGHTVPLTAEVAVTCGNLYHVKLAVCDLEDGILNSAVFLDAKSFKVPSFQYSAIPNSNNSFNDTSLVEGCSRTPIIFTKNDALKFKNVAVKITPGGTAIEGVDYLPLVDSVYLPVGTNSDTIYIEVIDDGRAEPAENIELTFENDMLVCTPFTQTYEVWIRDKTPLAGSVSSLSSSDTLNCPNDSIHLQGVSSGGDGNLITGWVDDPGLVSPDRYVSPDKDSTFVFFITDECLTDTVFDSITIYAAVNPALTVNHQSYYVCDGDDITLEVDYQGGTPPYQFAWFNGSIDREVTVIPRLDTTYAYYSVTDACNEVATDSILLALDTATLPNFNFDIDLGDPMSISFTADNTPRLGYYWDFGDGGDTTVQNPDHRYTTPGDYNVSLTVLTTDSCEKTVTKSVTAEDIYELYIPNAFTPNGDNLNDKFEIKGAGIEKFAIHIFNRWGELIFKSENLNDSWDGMYKGNPVSQGVYSFIINVETTAGGLRSQRGNLTVIH